ncbi:MAG: sulfurtransferase TusA family protein [Planctomycetota bacterium]
MREASDWLDDEDPRRLSRRVERVLTLLRDRSGGACDGCEATLCGHAVLFSLVLGHEDAPRCLSCLAEEAGREPRALRDDLALHLRSRECLVQGWRFANLAEGVPPEGLPRCHWSPDASAVAAPAGSRPAPASTDPAVPEAADTWDAGDIGCGDLVLALRKRVLALEAGDVLHLRATDPGAPEDIPAWCRLTGHRLVAGRHPDYFIERKG